MKGFAKSGFSLLFLTCLFNILIAAPVDPAKAKEIAVNFMNQNKNISQNSIIVDQLQDISSTFNFSQLYIFRRIQECGFVIVSANDCARPILAYSNESDFAAENIPQSIYDWLMVYEKQIIEAVATKLPALPEVAAEWEMLRQGQSLSPKSTNVVTPLITSKWGQNSPYNAMCPSGKLVGCVAIAMGQVMRYWGYPVHGIGSHSYTYDGQSHSVNFAAATYNYAAMPNSCSSSNAEVAKLLYHCGVAVEMEYGGGVSNAYMLDTPTHPYNAESALKNFFGYSLSAHGEMRYYYTKSQWISMLKTDLNEQRPVIYNGFNSSYSNGHCFICDGYDANNYFHFNWGQYGNYDGYFELDAMTPIPSQDFSNDQGGIFGLVPPGVGMEEFDANFELSLYPNPTTGIVYVLLNDNLQNTDLQVYNSIGELLFTRQINDKIFSLDLNDRVNGTYFISIIKDNQVLSLKKVVKEN